MTPLRLSELVLTVLTLALLASGATAQTGRTFPPPENVKILTGLDGAAIRAEMRRMAAAVGVDCDHCHVQGNYASDEKRPKRMALWMIELTRDLNGKQFAKYEVKEGESVLGRVTCYTCHQGSLEPRTAPVSQ